MARTIVALAVLASTTLTGCSRDPVKTAQQYIESGDRYVQKGKLKEASIEYRNAVKYLPQSIEAHTKLADVAERTDDMSTAVAEVFRLAELEPKDVAAQVRAGSIYLMAQKFTEARDRAQSALGLDASNAPAHILLGRALAGLHDANGSETHLREAARLAPQSAEAHIALANYLWSTGHAAEANVEFRRAVEVEPVNAAANRTLAIFLMANGHSADAEPYWKTVAQSPDGDPFALADYYVAQGRSRDSERELRELISKPTLADHARLRLSGVLYSQGDRAGAHDLIGGLLAHEPRNAAALVQRAKFLISERKFDEALAAARAAQAADPVSADAVFLEGQVHQAKGDPEHAVESFQAALKINPKAGPAATAIAQIRLSGGHTSEAVEWAERARTADPRDLQARLVLVRALTRDGQIGPAEKEAKECVAAWPNAAIAHAQLGAVEFAGRNTTEGERAFDTALLLDPRSPDVLLISAQAYAATGANDKAERTLTRLIEIDSSNLSAFNLLGQLYLREGRLDAAREEFVRVADRASDPVGAKTMVAMILQAQNHPSEARREYEQILTAHPRAAVAANNLAWMNLEEHRLDEALKSALVAKAELNRAPEVNDTLGWIYYQRGQIEDAIRPLAESVDSQPDNTLYRFHLAMAYWKAGSAEKAREELGRVLAASTTFDGRDEAVRVKQQLDDESVRRRAQNLR
jgi:tetratricopeptide (TPR) repeat protein